MSHRSRIFRAQRGDVAKEMWMKMLNEERAENANLRARIHELEAGAMAKTRTTKRHNKVRRTGYNDTKTSGNRERTSSGI